MFSTLSKYHGFFNTGLIFTPKVFILCQKIWGRGGRRSGAMNFDMPCMNPLHLCMKPLYLPVQSQQQKH